MTSSFLFRFGAPLESRLASQSLWSSGKRKRGDWVCRECRSRRGALRQRRNYSDGAWGIGSTVYLNNPFPPREVEENGGRVPMRSQHKRWSGKTQMERPRDKGWGLDAEVDVELGADVGALVEREEQVGKAEAADVVESRQVALWEQMERSGSDTYEVENTLSQDESATTRTDYQPFFANFQDIDYAAKLDTALLKKNPDLVARCLLVAERKNDLDFIRSISEERFSECIELLQPCNMIENLASAHVEMSEAVVKQMRIASMRLVAWEHASMLQEILAIRRAAGIKLSLDDYRLLLQAAGDLGKKGMALRLWRHLLEDGLTPDTACYNNYMAATIWNACHSSVGRHNVRVIPFSMMARQSSRLGRQFTNYRIGDGGVKSRILRTFGEMLKNGAIADEESFRLVITAAAREGDIATVKGVLKRVWNIDVDALQSGNTDESSFTPKNMEPESPLHPTPKLLFAIAHAFGINNDVPTALRLVDFVARHYTLDIDSKTWNQLIEWTFVLATPRTGVKARDDGSRTGQLPLPSVLSLWETMTGAPYHVNPTMGMYNHLIRNLQHRDMTGLLAEKMYEARPLAESMMEQERAAWKTLEIAVAELSSEEETASHSSSGTSPEALRRQWENLSLLTRRNRFWLKRWIRLFLSTFRSRANVDNNGDWTLRNLPSILWEWRQYAPTVVRYEVTTGYVEFNIRTTAEIKQRREVKRKRAVEEGAVLEKVPLGIGEWWGRKREASNSEREREEKVEEERVGKEDRWD